jgi:CubicO group peptidase (beta-lactamase class C family)
MNKNLLFFSLTMIVSFGMYTCGTPVKDSLHIPNPDQIDSVLNSYVDGKFFPFVYARVEDLEGNLVYEHSAVNQELLPNTTIDGNSWIRIWSMSKIVTITLALDLVEEGLIKLSDSVTKYIPEFENLEVAVAEDGRSLAEFGWGNWEGGCPIKLVPNDSVMTLLHLINHEAGFYYATTGFECIDSLIAAQNLPTAKNTQELVDRMAKLPLIQQPGTNYYYGTNTTVLGIVLERITNTSLQKLVEERITKPLKINGLQYGLSDGITLLPRFTARDSILRQAVRGELDIFGPDVPDYDPTHQLYLGGEGMIGTADGYADFIRMLLHHGTLNGTRYLEEETVKDIYAPHTQLDSPYGYNGYNLWVSGDSMRIKEQGEVGLWIGGGYECTHFWADPKRKFVGIVMSQNHEVRAPGYHLNDAFRGALYKQIWAQESN